MTEFAILSEQQIALLGYIRQGLPMIQCIRMAGYTDVNEAILFLEEDDRGAQAVSFSSQLHNATPNITVDLLTSQFYEERMRSTNALEGVACLREIGKINGLYIDRTKFLTDDNSESEGQKTFKQLQRMNDNEIIKDLEREGVVIDLLPQKIVRDK